MKEKRKSGKNGYVVHIKPGIFKLEKLAICTCGIAKFETGALYITYNYIINDLSRM